MKHFLTDNPQTLGIMVQNLIPQDLCTHDVRLSLSKSRLTEHTECTNFSATNTSLYFHIQQKKFGACFKSFISIIFFVIMSWKIK